MKKRMSRKEKREIQEVGNRRVDNHHVIVRAGLEKKVYRLYPLPISATAGDELTALAREIKEHN